MAIFGIDINIIVGLGGTLTHILKPVGLLKKENHENFALQISIFCEFLVPIAFLQVKKVIRIVME